MNSKEAKAPSRSHANDNGEELRALLEKSGEVPPVDFAKYAKRAAEVITRSRSITRGAETESAAVARV
jgi:hypothetical protein